MKNSPNSSQHAFEQSAEIPEEQRYALDVQKMNNSRVSNRFNELKERHRLALEAEKKRFEQQRDETVEALTQELMTKRLGQLSPHLRPKHLPPLDKRERERIARNDAQAHLKGVEEERLKAMEREFLDVQKSFVETAKAAQFRKPAARVVEEKRGREQDNVQSRKQSGHSR